MAYSHTIVTKTKVVTLHIGNLVSIVDIVAHKFIVYTRNVRTGACFIIKTVDIMSFEYNLGFNYFPYWNMNIARGGGNGKY